MGGPSLKGRYPAARDATVSPTETFGDVLKYWRGRAGLSLHQLEEAVGMSATNLSRIERGLVGPPTAEWLDKLAAALGAPRSRLYRAAGRIPPSDEDDRTDVIEAILSHAEHLAMPRDTLLKKTLFACDELSGFVHACALVRPTGLEGLEPKSVKKKLKQPSFAAGVHRDEVYAGAELIGVELDEHIANVVEALRPISKELGLRTAADAA